MEVFCDFLFNNVLKIKSVHEKKCSPHQCRPWSAIFGKFLLYANFLAPCQRKSTFLARCQFLIWVHIRIPRFSGISNIPTLMGLRLIFSELFTFFRNAFCPKLAKKRSKTVFAGPSPHASPKLQKNHVPTLFRTCSLLWHKLENPSCLGSTATAPQSWACWDQPRNKAFQN